MIKVQSETRLLLSSHGIFLTETGYGSLDKAPLTPNLNTGVKKLIYNEKLTHAIVLPWMSVTSSLSSGIVH